MMKLLRYAIAGLFALGLTATGLSANHPARYDGWDCCEPSPCCFETNACDVKYKIYGDFLYWDVARTDLVTGTDGARTTQYLNPDYDYGFRIGAFAEWNRWDFGLRYTWYQNESSARIPDALNNVQANFKLEADILDVELGHAFRFCSSATFRPFVGAKLAWMRDHYDTLRVTTAGDGAGIPSGNPTGADTKIDFHGYGVYLGACGRWELWNFDSCGMCMPIALVMRGSTGILRAQFNHKRAVGTGPNTAVRPENYGDHDCYIPVHEGYVGLETSFDAFCGTDVFFQIGYEAQYWGWLKYNDNSDTSHLGLGGLVVRTGLSF